MTTLVTLDFCLRSLCSTRQLSVQKWGAHSLFLRPLTLWDGFFLPSDGELWNGQLWIKEGTAYLSRQTLPLQKMALSPWSRVWSTAHWVINFPHMAWIRIHSQSTHSPKLQLFTTHRMFSSDDPQKVHTTFNLKLAETENYQTIFQIGYHGK